MTVPPAVVEHVARLAYIGLTPDEVPHYAAELSHILEHVARLQGVDTSGVLPTAHVEAAPGVLREDVACPSWPADDALANAPRREGDYFEVQAVLD
jgi:aspartyl-tRNA(Asn)/glutamyl-tRNA(Gln) amidotransferase subunit C